jgi:hypothetical protein
MPPMPQILAAGRRPLCTIWRRVVWLWRSRCL